MQARGLRTIELAGVVAAFAIPILSAALLLTGPALLGIEAYTHLLMPAVFGANLASLVLFVAVSRARVGPDRLRDLLGIGAIFSGICVSIVAVLAGIFSSLGG